jgi:hypothetical protein
MSFDRLIEQKIQEAMANGEFDNLPGKGEPLDLSDYFATPEDLRVGLSVLKNAGYVPEQFQLLKEAEALREKLDRCNDDGEKDRLKKAIAERVLKYNLLMEQLRGERKGRR